MLFLMVLSGHTEFSSKFNFTSLFSSNFWTFDRSSYLYVSSFMFYLKVTLAVTVHKLVLTVLDFIALTRASARITPRAITWTVNVPANKDISGNSKLFYNLFVQTLYQMAFRRKNGVIVSMRRQTRIGLSKPAGTLLDQILLRWTCSCPKLDRSLLHWSST